MDKDLIKNALKGIKLPPLTLDNKWHRLFARVEKTKEIQSLENKYKQLMLEEAAMNEEYSKLRSLKSKLIKEIQANMDSSDKKAAKKNEENSRLIDEINQKISQHDDRGLELPREIDSTNRELMSATMEQCYDIIQDNTDEIGQLAEQIEALRIQLKKDIVKKQQLEIQNVEIYSYMNDIFGPSVIDMFDISYDIEGKKQEIINRQRALKEQKMKTEAADGKNSDA